jgi:hypothetical protein
MDKMRFRKAWITGLIIFFIAYTLLYTGIGVVLQRTLTGKTMLGHFLFSLMLGVVSAILLYFRLIMAFSFYAGGMLIGFIEMFRSFIGGMVGWGDLIGIIALMVWIALGLGVGLLSELGYFLYKRLKRSRMT